MVGRKESMKYIYLVLAAVVLLVSCKESENHVAEDLKLSSTSLEMQNHIINDHFKDVASAVLRDMNGDDFKKYSLELGVTPVAETGQKLNVEQAYNQINTVFNGDEKKLIEKILKQQVASISLSSETKRSLGRIWNGSGNKKILMDFHALSFNQRSDLACLLLGTYLPQGDKKNIKDGKVEIVIMKLSENGWQVKKKQVIEKY